MDPHFALAIGEVEEAQHLYEAKYPPLHIHDMSAIEADTAHHRREIGDYRRIRDLAGENQKAVVAAIG